MAASNRYYYIERHLASLVITTIPHSLSCMLYVSPGSWIPHTPFTLTASLPEFVSHSSFTNHFIWRTASTTTAQLILFCTLSEKIHKNNQIQYHGYGTRTHSSAALITSMQNRQACTQTEDERKHLIHNSLCLMHIKVTFPCL